MRGLLSKGERGRTLRELTSRVERLREGPEFRVKEHSPAPELAELAPNGFELGSFVEWLADEGSGGGTLAFRIAWKACCAENRPLVVLDLQGECHPPALFSLGIEPDRTIFVRTSKDVDRWWSMDQALRCPGVGAVLTWADRLDARIYRRLRLAAEAGQALGGMIRPTRYAKEPSWATVRLLVEPLPGSEPRRAKVRLLRGRGATGQGVVEAPIDETYPLYATSRLAAAASAASGRDPDR